MEPFINNPTPLDKPISEEEVKNAIRGMSNNKATGEDGIPVELIKYGPKSLITEIAKILNNVIEKHEDTINVGTSILLPIQKPGKPIGPLKNLRPINLLNVIRKILSVITLTRIKDKINLYISPSQSAYRNNRSTTDIILAHRFICAKAQKYQDIQIIITGIDMSSAFDTIDRNETLKTLSRIIDYDEQRMCRLLLSKTTIQIQYGKHERDTVTTNVGTPQGDAISGTFFNVEFERSLRSLREKMNEDEPSIEHSYAIKNIRPPSELIYADDSDFATEDKAHNEKLNSIVANVLKNHNLKVNNDKTEHTIIKRERKSEEKWRTVKKLGCLLGDSEEVKNRKQKASAAMENLKKVWYSRKNIKIDRKLKIYNALVLPRLTYNIGTLGLTKAEIESLDAFHRKQLRQIWRNQRFTNNEIYRKCNAYPISQFMKKSRWNILGHNLRLPIDTPSQKAMNYYMEVPKNIKAFSGRPRATIATTINKDITEALRIYPNLPIKNFKTLADLNNLRRLAGDRNIWKNLSSTLCELAQVNDQIA